MTKPWTLYKTNTVLLPNGALPVMYYNPPSVGYVLRKIHTVGPFDLLPGDLLKFYFQAEVSYDPQAGWPDIPGVGRMVVLSPTQDKLIGAGVIRIGESTMENVSLGLGHHRVLMHAMPMEIFDPMPGQWWVHAVGHTGVAPTPPEDCFVRVHQGFGALAVERWRF